MVGNYNHRLAAHTKSFRFHSNSYHFKGLSGSYFVCKQSVSAKKSSCNRISLMRSKLYFRIHSVKSKVAAVIFSKPYGIESLVVFSYQSCSSVYIIKNPVFKLFFDDFLFTPCKHCFFLVQDRSSPAFFINDLIIYIGISKV